MATIHISGKNGLITDIKESHFQSVPFKIHADCDANVSRYFNTYVKCKENDVLTTSFRGRKLDGKKIALPEGYRGVVFHESVRPNTDDEERKFYAMDTFKYVTYWNWNKVPSKNDGFIKALDWINIAEALHSPITE